MRLTKYCKRALCFSLAVLILFLSPVSTYLDSKKTYEVNATGLEYGLLISALSGSAALISALLPSMGVSNISSKDASILTGDFFDWLEIYADSGLIVGGTTANSVLDILYGLDDTLSGDTSPIITIANDAAQVSYVASALYTFLKNVFTYDASVGTVSNTGSYGGHVTSLSVDILGDIGDYNDMPLSDWLSAASNYDSSSYNDFVSYINSFQGIMSIRYINSTSNGTYITFGFVPSSSIGASDYDGWYTGSTSQYSNATYLYNFGSVGSADKLNNLISGLWNYYTIYSFGLLNNSNDQSYNFYLTQFYIIGDFMPSLCSTSQSNAANCIYIDQYGLECYFDDDSTIVDLETDFAVDSSSMVDTAPYQDNATSISFNNVDIYEIAEAAVAAAIADNPDLTDTEQQAIFVQAVSDALAVSTTYDEAVDDTDEESTVYVPTTIDPAGTIDASDIEDSTEALNQQSVSNTNSIISGLQAIVNTIVDLPSLIANALGLSSLFAVLYGYLSNTLASVQSIPRYISDVADTITDTFSGLDSLLQSLLSGVTDALYAQTQSLADAIADTFPGLDDTLTGISSSISDVLTGITVGLPDAIGDVLEKSSIPGALSNVLDVLTGIPLSIANYIEEVLDGLTIPAFLTDIIDGITAIPAAVAEAIGTLDIPGAIVGAVEGIGDLIISIPDTITVALSSAWDLLWEWLQKIIDAILSVPATIVATLEDIISTIIAIPADIINLLSALLETLFVPSSYAITDEISELRSGFPFIDTLITVYEDIISIFEEDAEPPVIYIDLSAATSENFKYGDMIALVDFSWYADYKKYGDAIISAFLWLVFLWRLILNLPSIIQGGSVLHYGFSTDSESGELRAEYNELHVKR